MSRTINLKTKKEIWPEKQKQEKFSRLKNQKKIAPEKPGVIDNYEALNRAATTRSETTDLITAKRLEWSAPEFIKHEKNANWFISAGLIVIILLVAAALTKNFIFAVIIILSAFLIYIWTQKEPQKHKFKISPKGVFVSKVLYGFENLKSFWIFYDPPGIKYLSLESKKMLMPKINIPLGNEDPNKIREVLLEFLPEEEQDESLIDVLGRHLRY